MTAAAAAIFPCSQSGRFLALENRHIDRSPNLTPPNANPLGKRLTPATNRLQIIAATSTTVITRFFARVFFFRIFVVWEEKETVHACLEHLQGCPKLYPKISFWAQILKLQLQQKLNPTPNFFARPKTVASGAIFPPLQRAPHPSTCSAGPTPSPIYPANSMHHETGQLAGASVAKHVVEKRFVPVTEPAGDNRMGREKIFLSRMMLLCSHYIQVGSIMNYMLLCSHGQWKI